MENNDLILEALLYTLLRTALKVDGGTQLTISMGRVNETMLGVLHAKYRNVETGQPYLLASSVSDPEQNILIVGNTKTGDSFIDYKDLFEQLLGTIMTTVKGPTHSSLLVN